jgi:hypothetical protein
MTGNGKKDLKGAVICCTSVPAEQRVRDTALDTIWDERY